MPSATLSYAVKLHALNPTWELFFREVFGLEGAIHLEFAMPDAQRGFESTEDYREIIKMFLDALDHGPKPKNVPTKEVTVHLPENVHQWMKDRAKQDGYGTLTKYATHKLLMGCLEPNNGWNGIQRGLTDEKPVTSSA